MRALPLLADRDLRLIDIDPPPPPGPGEVQLAMRAVALNHIDVWGWRGKRALRLTLTGFSLLILAYFGSRFVVEVLLGRA